VAWAGASCGADRAGYFEAITAAGLVWFAECQVDAAIVEVGIGGRYDATNVVDSKVAVITNVASDHVEILGPTRADIAWDKAGIVKPGSTLVLAESDPELAPIFEATPASGLWRLGRDFDCENNVAAPWGRDLTLRTPGARYEQVALHLHGAYQGVNAACALAGAEALLRRSLGEEEVRSALAGVTSPGRMEVLGSAPWLILDGAKNPAGAAAAARAISEEFTGVRSRILVVGMLAGRDPAEMLVALNADSARVVVATAPADPRAVPAEEVGEAARSLGLRTVVASSVGEALDIALAEAATDDLVLVSGSLYVVGEARQHLIGEATRGRGSCEPELI
jgi:dihydrofolate synthase/folylpolyglutamate synthase